MGLIVDDVFFSGTLSGLALPNILHTEKLKGMLQNKTR